MASAAVALAAMLRTFGPADAGDRPARPAANAAKGGKGTSWWTIGIGSGVAIMAVAGSLAFLSTRKRPARPAVRKADPPPLPREEPAAPATDATAICVQPLTVPTASAHPLCEELEPSPMLLAPADSIQCGMPRAPLPPPPPETPADALLPSGPDSRGPTLVCGRCSWIVPAELGVPPWCPHCGGDLKNAPKPSAGAADHTGTLTPSLLQPPYFVGRADRSYRVYIVPKQLLFIDCPENEDRSATEKVVMGMSVQGGLFGVMIGSAIAGAIQRNRLARTRDRNWTVNMADVQDLIAMAERERDSFALDVEDLRDVTIEALTFWQHTFAERCAARLHFLHPVRGPMTFDLPRTDDVRVAIKQLTPLFGGRIMVNATWDWSKNRYVPKG